MNKSRHLVRLAMLLLPVGMMFSLVGCRVDDLAAGMLMKSKQLTIQATYESLNGETKTVLHDDGVYWSPHDSISVFYGSGDKGGSKFIAQATSEVRITNFVGEVGVVTGGNDISEDETFFWGLYPYDSESVCDGQTITAKISDRQIGAPNTFSPGTAPSLGRDQGLMLAFRNIYSGLVFSVNNPGFLSLTFSTNNGALIAGRAKIGVESGNIPVVREVIEGTNSVTVYAPTTDGFEVGKKYYILFFPFTGGFTMKLNSATQTGVFSFTGSLAFERNLLKEAFGLDNACQFGPLEVTRANFPDEQFANYVFGSSSGIDQDHDGVLSESELNAVEEIYVSYSKVASLRGIEYFPNLSKLMCSNCKLTDLDVGLNTKLATLICSSNQITSLDLSKNAELYHFTCMGNNLASLDVSHNKKLSRLFCSDNRLTSLDVTNNTSLTMLDCSNNPLSSPIDISHNTRLLSLECNGLSLTSLDLSHNPLLRELYCSNNELKTLDLTCNPKLNDLNCQNNPLEKLFVLSGHTYDSFLIPEGVTVIESMPVGVAIDEEHFPDSHFRTYVAANFDDGDGILTDFEREQVTKIKVCTDTIASVKGIEFFPNLDYLSAAGGDDTFDGQLAAIDVSGNPKLRYLICYYNQLTTLIVSGNTGLLYLDLWGNDVNELDFSKNTSLKYILAGSNPLTNILLPSSLQSINEWAFSYSSLLAEIDIPVSVTSVGNYAFSNCPELKKVTLHSVTPPTGGTDMFSGTHSDLIIYVPAGSVEAYQGAQNWSEYANRIQAIP